ncbi:fimbrial protein [Stenotrophomonas maltophilia]|uniref:fimbrial protein n=1 Tax=Stenotrophomonas maltophilia TaxID=40324 RepID=UPI00021E0B17|nr:fimbrial protein [Stenotrophomonas maltophilia]AEM51479.1 Fimbrial protein domain-containing protein [Stenotrophomonas maltophilia JV3]
MNKLAIALSAALSLGAVASANAADATINFSGKITALTCTIGAGDASGKSVALPQLTTDSINTGAANRQTNFDLVMGGGTGCAAGKVILQFKNSNVDSNGRLTNTAGGATPAKGVVLAIQEGSNVLDLNKDALETTFDDTTKSKTWKMIASYEKADSGVNVSEGDFSADLVVDVTF